VELKCVFSNFNRVSFFPILETLLLYLLPPCQLNRPQVLRLHVVCERTCSLFVRLPDLGYSNGPDSVRIMILLSIDRCSYFFRGLSVQPRRLLAYWFFLHAFAIYLVMLFPRLPSLFLDTDRKEFRSASFFPPQLHAGPSGQPLKPSPHGKSLSHQVTLAFFSRCLPPSFATVRSSVTTLSFGFLPLTLARRNLFLERLITAVSFRPLFKYNSTASARNDFEFFPPLVQFGMAIFIAHSSLFPR